MNQPTAEHALHELEVLVGEWTMQATWPSGETWPGRATYEWLDSKAHLLVRGSLDHPQAPDNVSVIGCDAANGTYYMLYSDARNVCRVMHMTIGKGELRLWREGAPFAQRFIGTFSADGKTITGYWEISEDGTNYAKDFDLTYRKVG
jgi:hypothetical protein